MTKTYEHGILVALDASEASERTLRYVARMIGGQEGYKVHLLHLLPPIPAELLEHGGSEHPNEEERLEEQLREDRRCWLEEKEREARPLFDRARSTLEFDGFSGPVETECRHSVDAVAVARDCLEAARASGCRTIAVGRTSLPWHRELFRIHACESLVKRAEGVTVWVVHTD